MGESVEQLTRLVETNDRYDIAFAELRGAQIAAMNERFQERKDADQAAAPPRRGSRPRPRSRSLEDAVPLLFPHTAYKSYPESFLIEQQWDRTVQVARHGLDLPIADRQGQRMPPTSTTGSRKLEREGFFVSCSSGTTGKSAMLVASQPGHGLVQERGRRRVRLGLGREAGRDRRMFGMAPVAYVPRNHATGEAYTAALQDPNCRALRLSGAADHRRRAHQMVVLRKKIADGTASPTRSPTSSRPRPSAPEGWSTTRSASPRRRSSSSAPSKLHVTGLWNGPLQRRQGGARAWATAPRTSNPENSIYVGGGLKRAKLPDDYREFVYETFNIQPERNYQNYSCRSCTPACRAARRAAAITCRRGSCR